MSEAEGGDYELAKVVESGTQQVLVPAIKDMGKTLEQVGSSVGTGADRVADTALEADATATQALHDAEQGLNGTPSEGGVNANEGTNTSGGGGQQTQTNTSGTPKDDFGGGDKTGQTVDGNGGAETGGSDPVDVVSGQMLDSATDVEIGGVLPLILRRAYASGYRQGALLGPGWSSTLDQRLVIDSSGIHLLGDDAQILSYPVPSQPGQQVLPASGARWPLTWDRHFDVIVVHDPLAGTAMSFPTADEVSGEDQTRWLRRIEDRNGNWVQIERDGAGVPLDVLHQSGCRIEVLTRFDHDGPRIEGYRLQREDGAAPLLTAFGYDDSGRLTDVTDSSGVPFRYEYDAADRVIAWTDRSGYRYAYEYDDDGRVVRGTGDGGFLSAAFAYDVEGRSTTVTDSLGHSRVYRYDEFGHICESIDELGNSVRFEYDRHRSLRSLVDEVGTATTFVRDGNGDPLQVNRPDGATVHVSYNSFRQPVRVTDPSGVAATEYEYDERGNLLVIRSLDGAETRFERDEHGLASAVTDAEGYRWQLEYDRAGRLTVAAGPSGQSVRYEYDVFGHLVAQTEASGVLWRYERDGEGRLTKEIGPGGEWSASYDAAGRLVEHRSETGAVTRFTPGPFQRLLERMDPDGGVYRFSYDTQLRRTAVETPVGSTWNYAYDAAGRLIEERDYDGRTSTYVHDAAGRVIGRTDPAGHTATTERDALGRIVAEVVDGERTEYTYDADGRVHTVTGPDGSIEVERDVLGRVTAETIDGRTVQRSYDRIGRMLEQVLPSGHRTSWQFSAQGGLASMAGPYGGFAFRQDAADRETARYFGGNLALTQAYNETGMRAGQALWANQATDTAAGPDYRELFERTYTYRADGHTASVTDTVTGTRTLTLDAPGRILSSSWSEGAEAYSYDGLGGLSTAVTPTQPATETGPAPVWDGTRGRGSRTHYDLDERGRVTRILRTTISGKRLQWHLTWNQRGRLTDAGCPDGSRWSYRYDPLGRRTAKEHWHADGSAGTRIEFSWFNTTLLEQRVVGAKQPEVTTSWDYHPQTGEPLAQTALIGGGGPAGQSADARWQAIIGDSNGAPVALVDAEGALTRQPSASVWGAPLREDAGPGPCPLRFAGQYHDPETGLHYNYARYYDPTTGHYLSPDPLGLGPDPNPRSYVGNPWDQTDPLGLARHTHREPGGSRFAVDPNKPPPPKYTRDTEYPHNYSAGTHEEMVKRWTDEGRKAGGWPMKGGVRMAMEDMTWRDADDNKLEIGPADRDRLTYDHIPPVVQHWNSTGYDTDRAARNAWHDNPDHLRPMLKGPNSSAGAKLPDSYRQDVGDNYKCGK